MSVLLRPRGSEILLIAAFAACVSFQLFVPPSIGLANNGDFGRMVGRFALGPESGDSSDEFRFVTMRWVYDRKNQWVSDDRSSELVLISAALLIGWEFSSHLFDIRILGAVHALVWISCFAALLPLLRPFQGWRRSPLALAALFIFTDVSYVAYCNSFYTDTAAFLFLAWAIVLWLYLMLRERPSPGLYVLFCAVSIFCISSKSQHAPLALFLFVLAVMAALSFEGRWRKAGALALALLMPLAAVGAFLQRPLDENVESVYAVIFLKILPKSPAPLEDARDLGLGPEYLRYAGYWPEQGSEDPRTNTEWRTEFSRRTSHGHIALFYLRHPVRALTIVYRDLHRPAAQRHSVGFGNYDKQYGFPPGALTTSFTSWSYLRSALFRIAPWHIAVWYAAFLAMAIRLAARHRSRMLSRIAVLCAVLAGMGLVELAVSTLAEALETDRHLFLFHVITDFTVLLALACGLHFLHGRHSRSHAI